VFCCDNLAFSGEVTMHRKHTVNVFRDLPPAHAHHLIVEAIRANVLPASRLPKVLGAWEEPKHEEFRSRTAWSLMNAFTEVQKGVSPRAQMEGSLRLSLLFRRDLQLS
jgi:hypothetical protein